MDRTTRRKSTRYILPKAIAFALLFAMTIAGCAWFVPGAAEASDGMERAS